MKKQKFTAEVLTQLINTSPAAMFIVDKDRNMLFANKSYAKMFGYNVDEVVNVNARKFHINDESYERFGKVAFEAVSKGKPVSTEFHAKKKNGDLIWVYVVGSLVKEYDLVLWTMIDITKRKDIEKNLEDTNYNLKQYLHAINELEIGIFVVNEDYSIRYMNDMMLKWFGNQMDTICYESIANLDEPCHYCKLENVIKDGKKVIYEPTTPDGQSFEIVATSIKNLDGTTSKMEVIRNITEQKKAQESLLKHKEELIHQAHHDALTGLPNRLLFNDRLEQLIENSKRNNKIFALLFIDLDNFKEINDSLGHHMGDRVLKKVTKRLLKIIRAEDTLSRLGGDEFTILMQNLKRGEDASVLAQKILNVLSKAIVIEEHEMYVSSSIGISLYPNDGEDAEDLLKYADSAMYKAKEEGKNNFQFYTSEMTQIAFERIVMETNLRSALKNGNFRVCYQPQIDAKKDKLIGMEALVRWKHHTDGIVSPAKFIPLAESTGLIVELDRFVMQTAMTQFVEWYDKGYNPGRLSLNLSMKQLEQKDFIPFLKTTMKETRCRADWLELEVTEGQIMEDPDESIKILNQITHLGIRLSIDDFGTGYSSLAYLKKLPINKLKIDRSFIKDLPNDDEDIAITKAVIALAKSLNLSLIAEGVETKEQKDFIIKNGCVNIQGYYYSKPLSSDDMETFLKDDIISKN